MKGLPFILAGIGLTVLCWGSYGPVLHKGQMAMSGSRLRPLVCVGVSYFVIAIIVPLVALWLNNELTRDWSFTGFFWSSAAGVAGSLGALGIIFALTSGGKPLYVMPLVFGCAPVMNAFITLYMSRAWTEMSPMRLGGFLAGLIMVSVGAFLVLFCATFRAAPAHAPSPVAEVQAPSDSTHEDT